MDSFALSSKSSKMYRLLFESPYNNASMIPNTSATYWMWQLIVVGIRMITPFSYVYVFFWAIYYKYFAETQYNKMSLTSLWTYFTIWMMCEILFFPYYYFLFSKFHDVNKDLGHWAMTSTQRQIFVRSCFDALKLASPNPQESHLYVRKAMEGYFKNVPIDRIPLPNFEEWVSWAFFDKHIDSLTTEEKHENHNIVKYIESQMQWNLKVDQYDPNLQCIRITLDPVYATQRPLAFYITIMAYNYISHAIVYLLGFRKREKYNAGDQSIYYRPASVVPNKLEGKEALPIVFFHGIGIGFATYLTMIFSFPREVDIYMVEWPFVAMQPSFNVPTSDQVIDSVVSILDDDNHIHACFIGHSLGTTAVSWMLRNPKGAKKVAATVLLDPVVFLLCDPTSATSFVHSNPFTAHDFKMHFFVCRELFIANTLSRHYSWSKNILFTEDLEEVSRLRMLRENDSAVNTNRFSRIDHMIFISKKDNIIPVQPVISYLERKIELAESKNGTCFELIVLNNLSHGEMFGSLRDVHILSQRIRLMCGLKAYYCSYEL